MDFVPRHAVRKPAFRFSFKGLVLVDSFDGVDTVRTDSVLEDFLRYLAGIEWRSFRGLCIAIRGGILGGSSANETFEDGFQAVLLCEKGAGKQGLQFVFYAVHGAE